MTPDRFTLFAQPWWVNLLIVVPFVLYFFARRAGIRLTWHALFASGLFAIAFGFVEAAVVVYIRASLGQLPGFQGTLADVRRLSAPLYRQSLEQIQMPLALARVETLREAATIVMLVAVAMLAGRTRMERYAAFLWCFALWDITYYAGLWAMVGWPPSLLSPDILFLVPVPWLSQVWLPILISSLTIAAVVIATIKNRCIDPLIVRFEPARETSSAAGDL